MNRLCMCGCGKRVSKSENRFILGHHCRGIKLSKEHIKKIFESRRGYKHTQETKDKIGKAHIGLHPSEEARKKMSESHMGRPGTYGFQGKHHSEESKRKSSKSHKGITKEINPNLAHSEESKRKIRIDQKRIWSNPKYRRERQKIMHLACHIKPTKPEKKLRRGLNKLFTGEYKFVGDGTLWIGDKNPDFININGQKKIIELFGDYWHSFAKTGRTKHQEKRRRIRYFAQYGFKTLIVWEYELKDIRQLKKKLIGFHSEKV